jgi:hypothetical protein
MEREEKVGRALQFRGGGTDFSSLKVPRQCPLILLVEVRLREGKDLKKSPALN